MNALPVGKFYGQVIASHCCNCLVDTRSVKSVISCLTYKYLTHLCCGFCNFLTTVPWELHSYSKCTHAVPLFYSPTGPAIRICVYVLTSLVQYTFLHYIITSIYLHSQNSDTFMSTLSWFYSLYNKESLCSNIFP